MKKLCGYPVENMVETHFVTLFFLSPGSIVGTSSRKTPKYSTYDGVNCFSRAIVIYLIIIGLGEMIFNALDLFEIQGCV